MPSVWYRGTTISLMATGPEGDLGCPVLGRSGPTRACNHPVHRQVVTHQLQVPCYNVNSQMYQQAYQQSTNKCSTSVPTSVQQKCTNSEPTSVPTSVQTCALTWVPNRCFIFKDANYLAYYAHDSEELEESTSPVATTAGPSRGQQSWQ
jgi:hypothetical protein